LLSLANIGIWNISAYHHGMMGGRTPNIDSIAKEVRFSPIIGRSNPAPRGAPHSSRANIPFGLAC
jgi:hypothetical protein